MGRFAGFARKGGLKRRFIEIVEIWIGFISSRRRILCLLFQYRLSGAGKSGEVWICVKILTYLFAGARAAVLTYDGSAPQNVTLFYMYNSLLALLKLILIQVKMLKIGVNF